MVDAVNPKRSMLRDMCLSLLGTVRPQQVVRCHTMPSAVGIRRKRQAPNLFQTIPPVAWLCHMSVPTPQAVLASIQQGVLAPNLHTKNWISDEA